MRKDDSWQDDGWLDDHLGQLDGQLRGILGARRISRREKRARAEQAIRAVDDLIERITEDLQQIEK